MMDIIAPHIARDHINLCWETVSRCFWNPMGPPEIRMGHVSYFTYDKRGHIFWYNPKTFRLITMREVQEHFVTVWRPEIDTNALRSRDKLLYFCAAKETAQDPRIDKVRKLLALSESNNPHEAALALTKAKQIMADMQMIDFDEIEIPFHVKTLGRLPCGFSCIKATTRQVTQILKFFDCEIVYYATQFMDGNRSAYVMLGHGTCSALKIADYVTDFLMDEIQRFWEDYKSRTHASGHAAKRAYQLGLLKTVRECLHEEMGNQPTSSSNHTVARTDQLEQWTDSLYGGDLQETSGISQIKDTASYQQGLRDGHRLHIRRGVNSDNPILRLNGGTRHISSRIQCDRSG